MQLQGRLQGRGQNPAVDPKAARELVDRLQGKDQAEWQKLLQDRPDLQQAARDLGKQDPEQMRKLVEQLKDRRQVDQPLRGEGWEKIFEEMGKAAADRLAGSTVTPPTNDPGAGQSGTQAKPIAPPDITPPIDGMKPGAMRLDPPPINSGQRPDLPRLGGDTKGDTGKALERWFPKSMRDSPAMKNFFRDLGKKNWSGLENARFWKEGKGPNVNWDRLGRGMKGSGRFLERNLPSLSGRHLPNAPNVRAPNLPNAPRMPSMGTPPAPGGLPEAGGAFTGLIVILALVVAGYLAWRLLIQPMQKAKNRVVDHGLGPWPLDPQRVRTRDELVRAFDYLSLLLLGLPAKMWHFRTVAKHLGHDEAKRPAAEHLAEAYMQARYAPPAELLPEPEMQRARTDLCSLAGVPAP